MSKHEQERHDHNLKTGSRMKQATMNRIRSFRVATSLLAFCLLSLFSPATADAQKDGTTHHVTLGGDIQDAIDGANSRRTGPITC